MRITHEFFAFSLRNALQMAVSADLAVATGKIIPILCATGYGLPDQDSGILSSL